MNEPDRPGGRATPMVTPPGGTPIPIPEAAVRLIVECEQLAIYREAQRLIVRALAAISVALGIALLSGGQTRFGSTPTFVYAAAVPGSYRTWGVAALIVGAWTFVTSFRWHRRGVMWGLASQCVVFTFFTVSIAVGAHQDRTTPFTGIAIYGGYAVLCAIAYAVGHELRREGRR
jgi:hypothetical protein